MMVRICIDIGHGGSDPGASYGVCQVSCRISF